MELRDAILNRKSIRGFKDTPVSKETLTEVLNLAVNAVSALNCQPWKFTVLTGEIKDKIGQMNVEDFLNGVPEDIEDPEIIGEGRRRRIEIAKQLFSAMDIPRGDDEKRLWWSQRGFRFFDAPAVVLIAIDKDFDKTFHRLDIGALMQNFTLAAMEYGLGTCVELQALNYQRGLKECLDLDTEDEFVIGIAVGYPDEDFPANSVVTKRDDIETLTKWYGFKEEKRIKGML